jgi:opacity protein-like surface antigen
MIFVAGAAKAQSNADTATQKELRHEIALYGAGGMSVLNYSLDMGGSKSDINGGIGGVAGIGYTWNINYHLGIVTGLEMTVCDAKTAYENISTEQKYGSGSDKFIFKYSMQNYIEEQNIVLLSIPAMLQYSVPLTKSAKFYLSGGFKIGLPVRAEATIFPGTVATTGNFYFEKQIYDDVPERGFYSASPPSISRNIDMKVAIAASLETGARFFLTENILLYAGAYLDCGLNNIRSTKNRELLNYQEYNPSVWKYASVLNTPHVNKVKTFAAGLKVKISFGW